MLLRQIFDPYLAQYAYLIGCQKTGEALIIDPERDIDRYITLASENGLRIVAVAETHIHADFVSGAQEFAADNKVHLYLSAEGGPDWNYRWPGSRPNTHLVKDGERFKIGKIQIEVVHTPGHTPEHISFLITDLGGGSDKPLGLVTGDFLFVGDVGRPDLLESAAGIKNVMEPSARTLQASLKERLAPLADYLQVLPAHGAGSACGKSLGAVPTSTLGYERMFNRALKLASTDKEEFVKDILRDQPDPPLYFATMKTVNRDGIAVTGGTKSVRQLSASEFQSAIKSNPEARILDTREDREGFDNSHIQAAISAPLHSNYFSNSAGSYLDSDDRILLVVKNSGDVELAVRQLYRIGFDNVIGWIAVDEATRNGLMTASTPRVEFGGDFNLAAAQTEGFILDVRTTGEFNNSHLPGAHSVPYTRLKEHLSRLPRDKRIFVHCASGKRAGLATSFLQSEGFDAVHVDGFFTAHKAPSSPH